MSTRKSWYRIEENRSTAPDVATIYLHDEIGLFGVTSKDFVADLLQVKAPVIKLHVNSPGGSVDDGISIFNSLKSHSARVEVYVDALAASIASVIAMAGDRVVMQPHSRLMVHEAMAMGFGFAADFEKTAVRLRDTTKNIASIYRERAGKDDAYWLDLMAQETWFSDQQAVDEGLADEIGRDVVENAFKIAANFNLSGFRNAPPELITPPANREIDAAFDALCAAFISAGWTPPEPLEGEKGEKDPEITQNEADPAPEGDLEPSLTPHEQAKADLERRLALIRL